MFFCPSLFQYVPVDVEGQCGCYHGYHGSDCSVSCVGGSDYPCHGKGICDTTNGTCTCYDSSNSSADCSACNDGWSGEDCSVADTTSASGNYAHSFDGF